jgi:hypothetical protein
MILFNNHKLKNEINPINHYKTFIHPLADIHNPLNIGIPILVLCKTCEVIALSSGMNTGFQITHEHASQHDSLSEPKGLTRHI